MIYVIENHRICSLVSRVLVLTLLIAPCCVQAAVAHVTCGSFVKLSNQKTGHLLHSLDVSYGSGSGQQAVIGSTSQDSAESMWIVRSEGCKQGDAIEKNQLIRLQHARTGKWLHSHLFQSPLSGQQEVSCFGSPEQSDTGDVWEIEWDDGKKTAWMQDMSIRLKHKDTGRYISNHGKMYPRPIAGHSEVFASSAKGKEQLFKATEGVYYSVNK